MKAETLPRFLSCPTYCQTESRTFPTSVGSFMMSLTYSDYTNQYCQSSQLIDVICALSAYLGHITLAHLKYRAASPCVKLQIRFDMTWGKNVWPFPWLARMVRGSTVWNYVVITLLVIWTYLFSFYLFYQIESFVQFKFCFQYKITLIF